MAASHIYYQLCLHTGKINTLCCFLCIKRTSTGLHHCHMHIFSTRYLGYWSSDLLVSDGEIYGVSQSLSIFSLHHAYRRLQDRRQIETMMVICNTEPGHFHGLPSMKVTDGETNCYSNYLQVFLVRFISHWKCRFGMLVLLACDIHYCTWANCNSEIENKQVETEHQLLVLFVLLVLQHIGFKDIISII